MKIEERINIQVEEFVDDYYYDDINMFKMEDDSEKTEDDLDYNELHESITNIYKKGNYFYVELNNAYLYERCKERFDEWESWRKLENEEYWDDRW